MTLIQRRGSALNLNLHFHVLFFDGVFSPRSHGDLRFHRVNAPTSKELNALVATISERVARYLERQGWLAIDEQSDHLILALEDVEGNTMQQLLRPLDHVPDSHGSAGRAQSADSLRSPLKTTRPGLSPKVGPKYRGFVRDRQDPISPAGAAQPSLLTNIAQTILELPSQR